MSMQQQTAHTVQLLLTFSWRCRKMQHSEGCNSRACQVAEMVQEPPTGTADTCCSVVEHGAQASALAGSRCTILCARMLACQKSFHGAEAKGEALTRQLCITLPSSHRPTATQATGQVNLRPLLLSSGAHACLPAIQHQHQTHTLLQAQQQSCGCQASVSECKHACLIFTTSTRLTCCCRRRHRCRQGRRLRQVQPLCLTRSCPNWVKQHLWQVGPPIPGRPLCNLLPSLHQTAHVNKSPCNSTD